MTSEGQIAMITMQVTIRPRSPIRGWDGMSFPSSLCGYQASVPSFRKKKQGIAAAISLQGLRTHRFDLDHVAEQAALPLLLRPPGRALAPWPK
jgi:hypothetical protein